SSQSRVAQALRWHSSGTWRAKYASAARRGDSTLQTTKKRPDFHPVSLLFNSYRLAGPLITAPAATIRVRRDQSGRTGAADQSAPLADSPPRALSPTARSHHRPPAALQVPSR